MTLEEIIADLEKFDDSLTIYASKSPEWSRNSMAELHPSSKVSARSPLPYFLEISVAKNVLGAWSHVRGGLKPTIEQKCEAIIYYAENDAYLLPE